LADLDALVDAGDLWTDMDWTDIVPVGKFTFVFEVGIACINLALYRCTLSDIDTWCVVVPLAFFITQPVRDSICVHNCTIYSVPVDADYIVTAVRDDLLEEAEVSLETWEEYVYVAEMQHGQDLNDDFEADYGACLAKGEDDTNFSVFAPLWAISAPFL
jgi:hypothetical protein